MIIHTIYLYFSYTILEFIPRYQSVLAADLHRIKFFKEIFTLFKLEPKDFKECSSDRHSIVRGSSSYAKQLKHNTSSDRHHHN